ncbi:alpha/beta fold hydrolase [Fuscibacter oryzae]|uniref:Alpha/beta fold hydrolase n=1 Tax=Fuscibacter oryzae TaxID=2803939 RepID=A0A8J7MVW2_9RHOB|nr:alpha/beta fold hydrolase [Fuscibacter oryzae]MBL4929875.1 alpha/beta fold hydrolase [Fuscibacter oryzae]
MNEPLVMIPGLMADARLFLPQMVALGAGRQMQVCLPVKGETVEQISEAMLAGLPERFALLGHGLGGDVALDLVRRVPERVTRVVLMATDPLAEPPATAAAREARMVAARAGRLAQAMREEIPEGALADMPWRADVMALVTDMALGLGEGVFLRQSKALQRRPDMQKTMRKVRLPALVLAGAADTLVPLRRQEFTAQLMPYGQLQVVPDAGHLASLEQPEAVSAVLEAFLNGPMMLR